MSDVTTEFQVEPYKITVSARGARSDGNYGSNEVFASVQQSIPDGVTDEQIREFVSALAEPLKAAIEAALPEKAAPVAQSRPATSGGRSNQTSPILRPRHGDGGSGASVARAYNRATNKYEVVEAPDWVYAEAAKHDGVKEIQQSRKRDSDEIIWKVMFIEGGQAWLNEPAPGAPADADFEEPF